MKLNILLLCDKPNCSKNANTILDHISSFEQYSEHCIFLCSNLGDIPPRLNLNNFDVIIIHYSLSLLYDHFLSKNAKKQLSIFNGLKVLFVQDEYRQINKLISEINTVNFDILFTCFPEEEIEKIYPKSKLPSLSKYNNLTGYIPEKLLRLSNLKPITDRSIDIGYRGRKIPYWLGELAYEKYSIVDNWKKNSSHITLKEDISYHENDRLYGKKWMRFMSSCKTTLAVESGASVMDFTGNIETTIRSHLEKHPNDTFHTIQKLFLMDFEGKFKLNQISPRCFEAIALKTGLVLYEGEYSNILIPDRHYIMLKKDFSNIHDVLCKLRDNAYLQNMVDRAYDEIALNSNYSYKSFITYVDQVISNEFIIRSKRKINAPYTKRKFKKDIENKIINRILNKELLKIYLLLRTYVKNKLLANYQIMPLQVQATIKKILAKKL
jgi:hypothetical protein